MKSGEQLRQAEERLLALANGARSKVSSRHTLRHVKDGFMHRLLISQEARMELESMLEEQTGGKLEVREGVRLSLFLGAFYVNMIGAIDNLAWAMNYEFGVVGNVDEEGRGRNEVGLFKQRFLAKLETHSPELSARLRGFRPWFMEVTSLRDPAAHRIPPGFITGQIAQEDLSEFSRLRAEAERSFAEAGKVRGQSAGKLYNFEVAREESERVMSLIFRGFELRYEAESLSKFTPLIYRSTSDGYEIAWAPSLIPRDQEQFIEVATLVIQALSRL